MRVISSLLGLAFAGLVVGCSAEAGAPSEGSPSESDVAVQPSEVSVVDSFELEGIEYTFLEVDGELGLSVSAPMDAPFPQLTGAPGSGKLTMLEIYEALQPEGIPNEKLVASHPAEALALGRVDTSVVRAQIATVQEKGEFSDTINHWPDCITALRTAAGISGTDGVDWDHTGALVNSGNNWTITGNHLSKNLKSAGVCNGFSTPALNGWTFVVDKKVGAFGSWTAQFSPAKNIALGALYAFYVNASATAFNLRVRTITHPASLAYLDIEIINDL